MSISHIKLSTFTTLNIGFVVLQVKLKNCVPTKFIVCKSYSELTTTCTKNWKFMKQNHVIKLQQNCASFFNLYYRDATGTPNFGRSVNPIGGGADSAHPILSPPQDFFKRTLHVIKWRITDYSCNPPIHFQEKVALVFALNK